MNYKYLRPILGLVYLCTAAVAHAQTSQPIAPSVQPGTTEQPLPANGDSSAGLGEIVVTAQRRSENLQRVAIPVSVVSAADLEAEVTKASDLANTVPSLVIASGGGGGNVTTIRGIGSLASNGLAEQVVAYNLDGVYLARPAAANGVFYDLERVEVLKGPQGTLYGRNAIAGAINLVSKRPTFDFGGDLDAQVGNYDLYQAQGALNIPLSSRVAVRIAAQGIHHDGYLTDGYDDEKQSSGRISILAVPTDEVTILVISDYEHFGGQGANSVLSPYVDPSRPYLGPSSPQSNAVYAATTLGGFLPFGAPPIKNDGFNSTDFYGINGNVEWVSELGTLTALPSFRRSILSYRHYAAGFEVDDDEHSNQTSLEMRFATPTTNPVRAVVGGYYFDESGNFVLDAYLFAPPGVLPPAETNVPNYKTRSLAGFGQATVDITSRFRLIGGVRYTSEKKSVIGLSPTEDQLTFNRVNWRAGAEFDAAERSLLYATVATGFKAGGFSAVPAPNTFKPETLTAYTVGAKNRFVDNKVQLNIEGFYWDYKNKQVPHLVGSNFVTDNAGSATLYGVEVEAVWAPTHADQLSMNALYNHTKYNTFRFESPATVAFNCATTPGTPGNLIFDCSGHQIAQAPMFSVNPQYSHTFTLPNTSTLIFGTKASYKSNYWLGDEQLVGERQGGYVTGDVDLTFHSPGDHWTVGAYSLNVGDRAVRASAFVQPLLGQPVVTLYPPRTFGARFGVRF